MLTTNHDCDATTTLRTCDTNRHRVLGVLLDAYTSLASRSRLLRSKMESSIQSVSSNVSLEVFQERLIVPMVSVSVSEDMLAGLPGSTHPVAQTAVESHHVTWLTQLNNSQTNSLVYLVRKVAESAILKSRIRDSVQDLIQHSNDSSVIGWYRTSLSSSILKCSKCGSRVNLDRGYDGGNELEEYYEVEIHAHALDLLFLSRHRYRFVVLTSPAFEQPLFLAVL
jgi:5-methylcytosine-specific restriction endonuclease McrA